MKRSLDPLRAVLSQSPLRFTNSANGHEVDEPGIPASVCAASVFINCMALALPLTILQVYDRVLPNQSIHTLTLLIAGLTGVIVVDAALKFLRSYLVGWAGAAYTHVASLEAFSRLMNAPSHGYETTPVSVYLNRLNALSNAGDYLGGQSRLIAMDLPFVPMFALIMYFVGGSIVLVPIVLFVVFALLGAYRSRRIREVVEERDEQDNRKYDFIIESLKGLHTIKSMAMEPQIMRRYERLQNQVGTLSHRSILLTSSAQSLGALYASLSTIVLVVYGGVLAIHGSLTIGGLACCMLLSSQIIQPLLRGIAIWSEIQTLQYRREEAAHLFELPPVPKAVTTRDDVEGRISVRNVSFRYADDQPFVLDTINLEIAAGEMIGLKGWDGSGRTTLLNLMRGDLPPTHGQVLIDGVDLRDPAARAFLPRIGYVGQTPFAFAGTVLENLTMFGSTSMQNAKAAAELIDLETEIKRYPTGFDTPLGDGTAHDIPATTAQRINIARTLAREPAVLILDEANTAFDHRGEDALMQALTALRGQITVIIASHRPALLRLTDRAFELKGGNLHPLDPTGPNPAASPAPAPNESNASVLAS
ncbi:MAG: ABC transporter transmembrane domain-containing protein [Pseudomonadota bacterium]